MLYYTAKRIILAAFILVAAVTTIFFLSHVVPADPVRMAVGLDADQETVEMYRRQLGYDRPLVEQYFAYMSRLARGDLGNSIISRQPVVRDIQRLYPATIELALVSMFLYMAISILLGSIAAMTKKRHVAGLVRYLSLGTYSLPAFWVGLVLQIVFFANLRILPAVGRISPSVAAPASITDLYLIDSLLAGSVPAFWSSLKHLALPVTTIVLSQTGLMVRILRVSILDVKDKTYVNTARAKGLGDGAVFRGHILRNAMLPVLTMAGIQFGWLLTGTVVVESIYGWPGLGRYAVESIIRFDYPAVMAVAIFATVVFLILNLIVDLLYQLADPRISYGQ